MRILASSSSLIPHPSSLIPHPSSSSLIPHLHPDLSSVLSCVSPAAAQFKEGDPGGAKTGVAQVHKWKAGIVVTAAGGPCRSIVGYVPVPIEWPEQTVKVCRAGGFAGSQGQLPDARRNGQADGRAHPLDSRGRAGQGGDDLRSESQHAVAAGGQDGFRAAGGQRPQPRLAALPGGQPQDRGPERQDPQSGQGDGGRRQAGLGPRRGPLRLDADAGEIQDGRPGEGRRGRAEGRLLAATTT